MFSSLSNMAGDSEGLLPIIGTMLMLSTPAAIITSASPTRIRSAAICTALMPDAQKRLTVIPPTLCGKPANTAPIRAIFKPWEASGIAQPHIKSSIACGSSVGTCASAACNALTSKSSGRVLRKNPRCERPMGVRVAATIYAS